jgi:hypothetical protein
MPPAMRATLLALSAHRMSQPHQIGSQWLTTCHVRVPGLPPDLRCVRLEPHTRTTHTTTAPHQQRAAHSLDGRGMPRGIRYAVIHPSVPKWG